MIRAEFIGGKRPRVTPSGNFFGEAILKLPLRILYYYVTMYT